MLPASCRRGLISSRRYSHCLVAATKCTNHLSLRSRSRNISFLMALELPCKLHSASIDSTSSLLLTQTNSILSARYDTKECVNTAITKASMLVIYCQQRLKCNRTRGNASHSWLEALPYLRLLQCERKARDH